MNCKSFGRIWEEDDHESVAGGTRVPHHGADDVVNGQQTRQGFRQGIKRGGALLAASGQVRLHLHSACKCADYKPGREHHGEREEILGVGHGEGHPWLDEEEIERGHGEDRGQHRWALAEAEGNQYDPDEIKHDHVDWRGSIRNHSPDARTRRNRESRPQIGEVARALLGRLIPAGRRFIRLAADHVDVDVSALTRQLIHERATQNLLPSRLSRLADEDLGDVLATCVVQKLFDDVHAAERDRLRPQAFSEQEVLLKAFPGGSLESPGRRGLDVHGRPRRVQTRCHPPGGSHESPREGTWAYAYQKSFAGLPCPRDRVRLAVALNLRPDPFGHPPQGQLAKGEEIPLLEEVFDGPGRLTGDVDLALPQSLDQVVGRYIHEFDLVRAVEDGIGDRLADHDSRNPGDHIIEALQVLDVKRREDVDARVEQLLDVLPPLRIGRARGVRVRKLVDEHQHRTPLQRPFEVKLLENGAPMLDLSLRQEVQSQDQRQGFAADVRLDIADDHVFALGGELARRLEHGVGFPDSRGRSEEDLQSAARPMLGVGFDLGQEGVGVGSEIAHRSLSLQLGVVSRPASLIDRAHRVQD